MNPKRVLGLIATVLALPATAFERVPKTGPGGVLVFGLV